MEPSSDTAPEQAAPSSSSNSSRKRKTSTSQHSDSHHDLSAAAAAASNDGGDESVEAMLAVPMSIIFRQVPSSQKPLLSRAEAKCFLQITMLAQEIDVLTAVSSHALNCRLWCRQFAHNLLPESHPQLQLLQPQSNAASGGVTSKSTGTGNPFLRPLLPLLAIHGSMIPNSALNSVEHELFRVLSELEQCGSSLKQFSEQNWTLSESLLETLGESFEEKYDFDNSNDNTSAMDEAKLPKGAVLAREKRRLSDLQEEVGNRIEHLLAQGRGGNDLEEPGDPMEEDPGEESQGDGGEKNNLDTTIFISLSHLCAELWNTGQSRQGHQESSNAVSTTNDSTNMHSNNPRSTTYSKSNRLRSEDGQEGLFSYPEQIQGLDRKMTEKEVSSTTQAVDALQALQKQRQQQQGQASPSSSPLMNTDNGSYGHKQQQHRHQQQQQDESQQSTHSVVSNSSGDQQDKDAIPAYVTAPSTSNNNNATINPHTHTAAAAYSESQVQRLDASEALAALAGF